MLALFQVWYMYGTRNKTTGLRFAILPPAGQRSQTKHVLCAPLCYLASGVSKISKKTRPWRTTTLIYRTYRIYRINLYIYINK